MFLIKRIIKLAPTLQWCHNGRDGVYCWHMRLFRGRSKKISKLPVTGLCGGSPPVTGGFPSQRTSNSYNVSIWWRHHDVISDTMGSDLTSLNTSRSSKKPPFYRKTLSDALSSNDIFEFRLQFHCRLFLRGLLNNESALVHVMASRQTDTPLPEPMITQFDNAYIRHPAPMSLASMRLLYI